MTINVASLLFVAAFLGLALAPNRWRSAFRAVLVERPGRLGANLILLNFLGWTLVDAVTGNRASGVVDAVCAVAIGLALAVADRAVLLRGRPPRERRD